MKKWLKWEFWPFWFFYIPIYFQYLWFGIRSGSFVFFSAANPSMKLGGFCSYSKYDILKKIPKEYIPETVLVKSNEKEFAERIFENSPLSYPIIVKPDLGERGFGVALVESDSELKAYFREAKGDIILQEYINYPLEVGVMYHRLPAEKTGRITSIVIKEFLTITGDGNSTFLLLFEKGTRTRFHIESLKETYNKELELVLEKGKTIQLQDIGNHCRGTTFLNGNSLISKQLEEVFDKIALRIEGYNFGRFDLRVSSEEDLLKGVNIKMMELNGANSEPAHIYDPNMPLITAYKAVFRHWKNLFQVSVANHKLGVPYAPLFGTIKEVRSYFKNR